MSTIEVVIHRGEGRAIYSDEVAPYVRALNGRIERATHVEPAADGTWFVDLSRFGRLSPVSGFETRREAIEWEIAWLKKYWLDCKYRLQSTSLQ